MTCLMTYSHKFVYLPFISDDTAVYLTVQGMNDPEKLQSDLNYLQEWEVKWDSIYPNVKLYTLRGLGTHQI